MSDIPQDVRNMGAKLAGEYLAWLNAGNSTGHLSEHAVAAMADTIARAILAAKAEEREACALIADGVQGYLDAEHAADPTDGPFAVRGGSLASKHIATAIRKREG